ncbi:MAG: branched-chain amino acid transport system / permease component family protein [Herminiimonas sp.]|nr:branched-chain amino acid transport system / permease component family protein [Herminiimonas sp.]
MASPAAAAPGGAGVLPIQAAIDRREGAARDSLRYFAWLFILLALAFGLIAWLRSDVFFFRLATEALILGGFAMGVDLLLGFTGLLSLGHALFFGLGAYVSGLVLKEVSASFWAAMLVTLAASTVAGAIAGIIAIRARGVYFALITFGMAEVVSKIVFNTRELGGSDGIIGIPVVEVNFLAFSVSSANAPAFFLLVLALMMGLYFLLESLLQTPFGRLMVAMRANEHRVPFLGFSVRRYKLLAFILASNVCALSGALYPMLRGFVSPELMFFQASGNAVITVILGGVGTLIGPLYGSVILTGLKSVIGTYTEHHLIVIGALFMLSVIFFPKGLVGYLRPRMEAWLLRRGGER